MNRARRRLTLAAAAALGCGGAYVAGFAAPREKVVRIVARRFEFMPSRLTLRKGVPVMLELTTLDVLMGLNLPDFNVRADIVPGRVARVRFVPDRAGTFTFLCDVFCGSGHEAMQGSVTVVG